MDYNIVIFWLVVFSCLSALVVMLTRVRSVGFGWVVVYLAILLVCVAGWCWGQNAVIYTSAGMWVVFGLLPGLIGKVYYQRFLQRQYSAAYHLARIIRWLHPADGWIEQPEIMRALEQARRGELKAAMEVLRRFQEIKSAAGVSAIVNLYRITGQWDELLAWNAQHGQEVECHPQLLAVLLRARGETGDLRGLVELFGAQRHAISKLVPSSSRDICRLMLFAFCGKRQLAERLFGGGLSVLPATTRQFWLATADLAAGATDSAKRQLEALLPETDAEMRLAIERRLSNVSVPPQPLDASAEVVIEEAAREQGHEESFGAQRSLFSRQARATQTLIVLNVAMFALEIWFGGGTNPESLFRLGALFPPAVRAGEWWRLIASLFLHYGALHLAMNMFALWMLGPFAEFALGFRRYLLVYLLSGIGSMGVVMAFSSGPSGEQFTVGASGCIMGLVGATGALMLRGWLRERALSAKRRLVVMVVIVAMQSLFDSLVPQVSMTAHLSGALIGFAATMIMRDRFVPAVPRRSVANSS